VSEPTAPRLAPQLEGIAALASANDAPVFAESIRMLLAALIDLLGHLIGEELAVDLVSQAAGALRADPGDAHSPPDPEAAS
jgi:hypothetical protein